MIELSTLLGQDAISLNSATKTGTVTGIGLTGNRISSVELSDTTIPADAVRSFEGDVLTFDDNTAPTTPATPAGDPRGSKILDMNGDIIGVIADLTITADGTIDSIIVSSGQALAGDRLRAIGTYAAIVAASEPTHR